MSRIPSAADVVVRAGHRLRESLGRPEVQTDLTQILKATVAAVLAWAIAAVWLDLDQPFLAPWSALLTVHATIVRTFWRGAQSVLATLLGLVLSFLVVLLFGYGALAIGLGVLLGLLLARVGGLRTEGVTVATTALFVLTAGYGQEEGVLAQRFLDTLIGVAVGIVVNVLLAPPLDDHAAEKQLDRVNARLGSLLRQMSEDLSLPASEDHARAWIEETRGIDADLDQAKVVLRFARESQRWNLRRRRSRRAGDVVLDEGLLVRLEEGVAQGRAIARVAGQSVSGAEDWDRRFRDPWLRLLDEVGARVADPEADVEGLHERIEAVANDLSGEDLPALRWTVYGTLLYALRIIVEVVDDVGSSHPRTRVTR